MALAGIYIPKKSSAAGAALDDSGLKQPGKNLLAVMREGRPARRHSMSADPAHLARIVAAAAAEEKAKGQRPSPPPPPPQLFLPRRPSLLPRSPYSVADCADPAAQLRSGSSTLGRWIYSKKFAYPHFLQPFVGAILTSE